MFMGELIHIWARFKITCGEWWVRRSMIVETGWWAQGVPYIILLLLFMLENFHTMMLKRYLLNASNKSGMVWGMRDRVSKTKMRDRRSRAWLLLIPTLSLRIFLWIWGQRDALSLLDPKVHPDLTALSPKRERYGFPTEAETSSNEDMISKTILWACGCVLWCKGCIPS